MKQLILGGARSGKSKLAEQTARQLSEKQNKSLHYVATALPFDDEMRERIKHHQAQRGEGGMNTNATFDFLIYLLILMLMTLYWLIA